ncbi:MAG: D-isomer specific 2-hydroxyacid dehydrogenase, NAD-binding [Capsulimonas sp.]|jgi:phosphoglycerate dehydrogenase-like enzyme|nr:D-isomer specific 2-hydroxyacid dehydrogenase, NAD-binding [Capsulimonas sp.]
MPNKNIKIAVVNSSSFGLHFPDHLDRLARIGAVQTFLFSPDIGGEELAEALHGYEFIIASVAPRFPESFFRCKDRTRLIARHGIGFDSIDLACATQSGVIVTKVAGWVEREAVAEHTIALMIEVMRKAGEADTCVRSGLWARRARLVGFEIKGKTLGVIGSGNIGGRVCEIAARGFGARVIAHSPYQSTEDVARSDAEKVDLETLLRESDIISLHCALTPETRRMLSDRQFAQMKPGVFLINTARGELMDETALATAIDSGKIAGLGIDVISNEPAGSDHPLLQYPNVVMTPHISAYTMESLRLMGEKMVEDVERVAEGRFPEEVVNTDVLRHSYA